MITPSSCEALGIIFEGSGMQANKPKSAPAWMPDKIWKPKVNKVGTGKLEEV
jgi:Non-histone chromosomal protein MC1